MGVCRRCGSKGLALGVSQCSGCGAWGCDRCQYVFSQTQTYHYVRPKGASSFRVAGVTLSNPGSPGGYAPDRPVPYRVCGQTCLDQWAWRFISSGAAPSATGGATSLAGYRLETWASPRVDSMYQNYVRGLRLENARTLMIAEDFENAARIFQDLGMWKEAGDARRRGRQHVVTQVHVNVNDLVDRLRGAGISTDYTCPACGGSIRITGHTSVSALANCDYCGSTIQTTDLVEFLTKVVGYR